MTRSKVTLNRARFKDILTPAGYYKKPRQSYVTKTEKLVNYINSPRFKSLADVLFLALLFVFAYNFGHYASIYYQGQYNNCSAMLEAEVTNPFDVIPANESFLSHNITIEYARNG